MSLAEAIARQLRQPSGVRGRAMAYLLNRFNRPINQRAVERLDLGASESVVEIGFGGGAALAGVLARTEGFVAGIEISEPMIDHVRRRLRGEIEEGRLELRRAGVSEIPYEDGRFDRALSVQTIYFWPDPAAGLREIHRVLKPGGRVLVATATKEEMDKRSWADHGFQKFDETELADLLRAAGFTAVTVERDGPRVFSAGEKR
jgi:ubiquinone/menaquinone biosynthesis C-methylase UbiE